MEYFPVEHSRQLIDEMAPVAVEYVPAAQASQSDSESPPAEMRYFPAPHSVHVEAEDAPETDEYLPGAHRTQYVSSVLPWVEANLPGPHARHVSLDDAPIADEYLPASHATQLTPTCRFPAVHASQDGKPSVDVLPSVQSEHSDSPAFGN